jgi:DNA-binding LacI/PurR family transcriptional regulator
MGEGRAKPPKGAGAVKIADLANRIVEDIRARQLGPGDPYLTAAETARQFRTSATTANKALQVLTRRRVLDRRQRSGAVVADPAAGGGGHPIRRVHILVPQKYVRTEGVLADGILIGLQGELPGARLQFDFLPAADDADAVRAVLAPAARARNLAGFVLVRSSLEAQRLVHASGLPAVVLGSLYPSVPDLCHVERDQRHLAALLTGHLLDRGARRVVVLLRDRVWPGDHPLLDGVLEALARARIDPAGFVLRCLSADLSAVRAEVREVLGASAVPAGLLCRSEPLADGAAAALDDLGLTGAARPPLAVTDVYRRDDAGCPYAHARWAVGVEEVGREIGRLLAAQAGPTRPPAARHVIPVELVVPPAP